VCGGEKWLWDRLLSEYFGVPCHYHVTVLHTHKFNHHPRHITLPTDSVVKSDASELYLRLSVPQTSDGQPVYMTKQICEQTAIVGVSGAPVSGANWSRS
jgi:hypothetical protein